MKPTVTEVLVTPGKGRLMVRLFVVVVACPTAKKMAWLARVPEPVATLNIETRVASVTSSVEENERPTRVMVTSEPSKLGNVLKVSGVRIIRFRLVESTDGVTRTCWPFKTEPNMLNLSGVVVEPTVAPWGNAIVMGLELAAAKEENTRVRDVHRCPQPFVLTDFTVNPER